MGTPPFGGFGGGGPPRSASDIVSRAKLYHTGASEKYGPGTDRKQVLKWCVPVCYQDACCGAPTVSVLVRVKLEDPKDDSAVVDLSDVFATIAWGSGEGDGPDDQEMDFDVVGGGCVTVQAWELTVYFSYPPFGTSGVPTPTHPIVHVDVSVGIGTSGKASVSTSATRTVKVAPTIGAGLMSGFLPIPLYAAGARIVNSDPALAPMTISQFEASGGQIVSAAIVGKLQPEAVPVARGLGARFFRVTNNALVVAHDVAVIFDLMPN